MALMSPRRMAPGSRAVSSRKTAASSVHRAEGMGSENSRIGCAPV